jgi:hypothetical protein
LPETHARLERPLLFFLVGSGAMLAWRCAKAREDEADGCREPG